MKKWIRLLLYIILVLILSEIGLRFIDPPSLSYYRNIKLLHRYHRDYYVTLGKNLDIYIKHYSNLWEGRFTTNSLGFRGSPEPDGTSPKLACLGDSLVMGFGVSDEDTFCSLLNGFEWNGRKYEIQNLAVDAYGSLGSAKRLKESSELIDIDTVLFFVSPNDFTVPPGLAEQGVLADDIVEKQRENDDTYRRKFFLQFELTRYSYLLQAMKLANEQLKIKRHFFALEAQDEWLAMQNPREYLGDSFYRFPPPPDCSPDRDVFQNTELEEKISNKNGSEDNKNRTKPQKSAGMCPEPIREDSHCQDTPPDTLPPLPEETVYAYNLLLDTIRTKNIRLIVAFIPMQNEDLRCYNNGKHSPLYEYALRSKKFFQSHGIETIEFLDVSREVCPIDDFFIPGDGHLTKKGNRWVAEQLKTKLKKLPPNNNIIPEKQNSKTPNPQKIDRDSFNTKENR